MKKAKKKLRVLHIEDSERDAAIILRALSNADYDVFTERVENAETMRAALDTKVWDVILCDYVLPSFDAPAALAILRSSGLDIPLIVISGVRGEDAVVGAMLAGASDYLMKSQLVRLVPAIERELKEAQNRRERNEVEAQLKASEERWRAIYEAEPECVKLLGKDGELLEMNPAGLAMIEAESLEQVRGKMMIEIVAPEYQHDFLELGKKVFKGESGKLEFEMIGLKGTSRRVHTHATPLLNATGEVEALLGLTRDVTKKRQVDEKLQESESLLSSTQRIAHIGSWVIDLYDSGKVGTKNEYWSDEHFRIYGFEPGSVEPTDEVFYNSIHPDDRERLATTIREAIEHKTPFDIEHRIILPDGRERIVHAISELVLHPTTGKPVKLLGSVQDITERKRAEAELIKSREHMARAQNVAKLGSWEMDLSTMHVIWSEETYRIFEKDLDSFRPTYRGFLRLVHPDDRAAVAKAVVDSTAQLSDCLITHRLVMPDGRIKFIKERWEILHDANGLSVTAFGTCQDTTRQTLAEASQRESEERLRLLFDQMKDGFYYSTREGQLLDVNPAFVEMFGYSSKEEMLQVDVVRDLYFSAEERESQTLDDGKETSEVYRMRRKDGSAIWVEDRGEYKYDDEGNVAFHQGLLRDVTERVRSEEAMRESEERYRLLFDNNPFPMWVYDVETLNFLAVNDAASFFYGYSREEFLGMSIRDIRPETDIPELIANINKEQSVLSGPAHWKHRKKDGTLFDVEITSHKLPFGERDSRLVLAQNITERKLAQESLIQSEEKYRDLIENAYDMIYTRDMDGKIISINTAGEKLTGYSRDEFLQLNMRDVVVPEDWGRVTEIIARKLAGIEGTTYEMAILGKGGRRITLEVNTRIMYRDGAAVGVQGIARDVTERKRVENQLIESEAHKGAILESALDCIIAINDLGLVTEFNPAAETLFGYSRADALGTQLAELIIPPGLRDQHRRGMEHYLATGEGPVIGKRFEISAMRSDGSEFPVELAINAVELNGTTVFTAYLRDISERKLIQETLMQSEQRYRDLVENAHDIIYSHDLEGNYTSMNAACEHILGYTQDEALKLNLVNTAAPGQLEKARTMIERKLKGEETTAYELDIIAKDGRLVTVEVNSKLVLQDGVPVGIQGIARDVSERKAVREELEQNSALLRIAGQAAQLGAWKIELPERTLTWSDENCIIHDREPGYVPTLEEGIASYYPEHRDQVLNCVNNCSENGTPYDFELPIITAKGRHIWIRSIGEAVRDTDGKIIRLQGAIQDITERKEAEESLRQKNSLIRIAGELTLTGAWALELRDKRGFWSDELFGILEFPRGETPDYSTVLELYPQPGRDKVIAGLEACSKDGTPLDMEVEVITGKGRRIWARLVAEADRKSDGTIERIHGAFQDISDRKATEEQLRQSQKLESVGRLAGGIAHDFNNMLTAINGYSDLALRQLGPDEPLRHNIEEIKKAGERSASLTNQLLAFSRKQVLHPELIKINDVILETSNMLERLIGEDIELVTVLKSTVGNIKADRGQLEQIVMNLTVNARDAMPKGGKLTIETFNMFVDPEYADLHVGVLPGPYVVLSVSDSGTGISPEIKAQIFEPFFTTKEVGKGTGLGLATVYGIVKQSGGGIFVYSEIDHGTTFKIFLPRVADGIESPAAKANIQPKFALGTETILLVEDEELLRTLSRKFLESSGYKVVEASDGIEAIEIFDKMKGNVDIVVTDVVMPRMGGRELVENLLAKKPGLPVLFTSGYPDDAVVRHGILDGKVNFVQKPFSIDKVALHIRNLLDSR